MTQYFGDYSEDATVYIPFNTFTSDDPSASATITDLADADIKVHKDGSATEIVTDGATIAIDFDGVTGNHLITINTAIHADYATGSDYLVRIEGTTVDAATVNAWVGVFSIERTSGAIAQLKAMLDGNNRVDVGSWLGTAVTTSATTSLPEVDAKSISDNAAAADNVQANIGNLDAPVSTVDTVVDGIQTDLSNGTDGLGAIKTAVDAIPTSNPTAAAIADAVWDEAKADHTGAATFGDLATDVDTIAADVVNIDGIVPAAAGDSMALTAAAVDAVWDEDIIAAHNTADTAGHILGDGETAWPTATGFSTHNAAGVWASGARTLTANTNLNDPTAADVATAVVEKGLADDYAANGSDPTLQQCMMAVHQMLMDFGITGTSIAVRKVDGSAAFTVTLDSASAPTDASR